MLVWTKKLYGCPSLSDEQLVVFPLNFGFCVVLANGGGVGVTQCIPVAHKKGCVVAHSLHFALWGQQGPSCSTDPSEAPPNGDVSTENVDTRVCWVFDPLCPPAQ
jgi:hypothetical protein